MANENLENIQKRVLRGDILKVLVKVHREFYGSMNLVHALRPAGYELHITELREVCEYLAEKGYVEMKDTARKSMGLTMFMVRLSAKGKDLFEGSLPDDPGIILRDE